MLQASNTVSVNLLKLFADRLGMPVEWTGIGIEEVGKPLMERLLFKWTRDIFVQQRLKLCSAITAKPGINLDGCQRTNFEQLVKEMVEEDLKLAEKELIYAQG